MDDISGLRKDFPVLQTTVRGKPLVYLDSAATTQKPRVVIDAISKFYSEEYSNVHRGVYYLSDRATSAYEDARRKVQRLINASSPDEIVFVRSTTEAINLVAASYGRKFLKAGDEVLITAMEHHSNIVPWQMLCGETGAVLKVVPVTDSGELDMAAFRRLCGPRTKFVSVVHISNVLGTINPVKKIVEFAHLFGAPVLLDGAQALPHERVDVQELECDFYAFSGHKMYGPSGIGVLYGKAELLSMMPPYQGGGEMIEHVGFDKTTFREAPYRFEAGTPNISGSIGLGAAVDYLGGLDRNLIMTYERELLGYALEAIKSVPGLRVIGTAGDKVSLVSFVLGNVHAHDIGTILDMDGIAVRAGHHCAQPLMERFGVPATVRASFAFYNTREEIDWLVRGLQKVREVFK